MTLTPEQKKDLSSYRLQKSRSLLEDAQVLYKNGSYESSINRAYYAVLSAAKALLILRGIDPETHEGVKTMISREFVKNGLLPKEYSEYFRNLQSRRLDSDYGDFIDLGKEEAEDSLTRARQFVDKMGEIIDTSNFLTK